VRILHLPTEIAGQVYLSAKGLREIGMDAYNTSRPNPYGYPVDIDPRITWLPFLRDTRDPFLFFKWLKEFDLFHYNKSPYLPRGLDIRLLQKNSKHFVVEFWGSDIRLKDIEKKRNPFFVSDNADNQKRKLARLRFWSENTDEVIFSDHSADVFLNPFFKKIHVVGQRKATKGTSYIKRAVEELKKAGLDFEYIEVFGVSHIKAMQMYSQADIIVDQLIAGSHGVFACEAMALGKPVICYILDELIPTYPVGFPIVNANPNTIEEVLEELICSPEKRYEIGVKGREYAEKVHDIRVVARKLKEIYQQKMSF